MLESVSEDPRSVEEHTKALVEEMKKSKPRDAVLLPLMKSTFQDRRIFIQNDAKAVIEILDVYPPLSRPAVVSLLHIFAACTAPFLHDELALLCRLNRKWASLEKLISGLRLSERGHLMCRHF